MADDLRFQVIILPNAPWDELLKRFTHVEELGFDLVTTGDHFVDWNNPSIPWLEAWTVLAAVARETTRIRIATYVTQIPLRNPALLARQALSVDHISQGRLEVGLGVGLTIDPAYEMMGIPNWEGKERVARFKEYVEIVDALLSNEVTSYEGTYYRVKEAVMNPRPLQKPRPPIVIAALGPVMMKHAARYADNWNSLSFAQTFEEQLAETRDRIARMDENCATIGRDASSLRRSYLMFDPASRASGGGITYYESEAVFEEMVRQVIDLGISEVGLYYPILDVQKPMFEKIAKEVIPALKARYAGGV
ncbi:MAG: LLM class flavin-dependent oxidoreductase [Alphaproteobacteria bacterium]|jgi:alkanesulfonate monooxygenase SsuD/methylene tetrahydromethanopterin reductase-like flavin-dependent oxidoreductase (luciferase family)|nr:LLM class flavin-dependent oxidoreductase [Alphaproteobacteria bacterium]